MISKDKIIGLQQDRTKVYTLDVLTEKSKVFVRPCVIKDYKLSVALTKVNVVYDQMDDSILYYTCDQDELFETEQEAYKAAIAIMDNYLKEHYLALEDLQGFFDCLIDKYNSLF